MKPMRCFQAVVAASVLGLVAGVPAGAMVGSAFTYQGELNGNGMPVNQASDFEFRLWDAAAGGNQIGLTETLNNHPVSGGRFIAHLDFGVGAFAGEARWVEISVRSPAGVGAFTTLSPRQELTPVPYAIHSTLPWQTSGNDIFYDGARVGIGTNAPQFRLDVRSPAPRAIFGLTTNPNGNTYGVWGQSDSDQGIGVFGFATANSGAASGVAGYSDSPGGRGVWGFALDANGQNFGVYGETNSDSGYGGFFLNDGAGVALLARSALGNAIHGDTNGAGSVAAIHGRISNPAAAPLSTAVRGQSMAQAAGSSGVWGSAMGAGTGVFG